MNLLDKIKNAACLFVGVFLWACEESGGALVLDTDDAVTVKIAEFDLQSRNIIIDSLRTDHENIGLVGVYDIPNLGSVSAVSNLEFRYTTGAVVRDTMQYDSLILSLNITDYTQLPVDSIIVFTVHPTGERIFGSAVYLSDRSFPLSIRADTIRVKVTRKGRPVKVRLSSLGPGLFSELTARPDNSFPLYRRTIILAPVFQEENQLFSFNLQNDSTSLILYSSRDTLSYRTNFDFRGNGSNSIHFNTVNRDRTSSNIAGYSNLDTFSLESNATYINPLVGVYTQVDLEPFNEFVKQNETIIINKAELTIQPHPDNEDQIFAFRYFFHDERNGIRGEAANLEALRTVVLSNQGYLTNNNSQFLVSRLGNNNNYFSDLTLFTELFYSYYRDQGQLLGERLVLISNINLTVNQAVLSQNDIKLRVYYTSLK